MHSREKVISLLVQKITALQRPHPVRVAINGRIASGKTTFATELALAIEEHGRPVLHVGVDGFHNPSAVRHRKGRASARGYYEDAYDLAAVRRRLLQPLGLVNESDEASWQVQTGSLDLESDRPLNPEPISVTRDTILIVDGSFLLASVLRDAWDFTVFLDVSRNVATERGAQRDAPRLGSLAIARDLHEKRYQAACDLYFQEIRPDLMAQVVIANDDFLHPKFRDIS
ncbi:hypothetical protein FNJ84_03070 [Paracoccus sp. M683]|uniref:hypothetical protein n=1 Tax=Paracoccus sp. M683 TaxID=2594268 RepID=UPI0011981368|nr:hypothetical protein [Paracoccus sp. M683]TRW99671.1 hypothetical protein FNJ84_03070 [Paracoccus sp. M683]